MTAPRALPAPQDPVVMLTRARVDQAVAASRMSDRKRVIAPFHKSHEDSVHRMFNAMQPGTYARPHRHRNPPKSEVFLALQGSLDFLLFDERGELQLVQRLSAGGEVFGIDLIPGLFHSVVVRSPDTVLYEVKAGPYSPMDDKDFASWAPAEGAPEVAAYVRELEARIAAFAPR